MQYTKLGKTDIEVSKICLGCMSFGERGTMHDWTLAYNDSKDIISYALDKGINFFDTANQYSKGTSEEYLGRAIRELGVRDKVVLASKVYFNKGRLSKNAIFREIEGTLKRLGTDYLDLYIIHRFDYDTPILETMEALDALVKAGKVRAIGASAMYGYQFHNMQDIAKENGLTMFSSMQNHYNLIYREDERELIPICRQFDVSLTPYSPLAAGHLARSTWSSDTLRSKTDRVAMGKYDRMEEADMKIVERVEKIAQKYGVKMSSVALAWLYHKGVASPVIGATKKAYIDDAAEALDISLTKDDMDDLEELYVPHPIVGAISENPPQGVVLLNKK